MTDGTAAGTQLLKDIDPGIRDSQPNSFTVLGNQIVFAASDGTHGDELWVTDGTAAGTQLVKDIRPGSMSSDPRDFTQLGNKILFRADDGAHGRELWVTDGTAAGTQLVKDINPGAGEGLPGDFTRMGDKLIFRADDGANGEELWVTDGTAAGTLLLKDINLGAGSSEPFGFAYFNMTPTNVALSAATVKEFRANGTVVGTLLPTDFDIGDTYTYTLLNNAGGRFAISGDKIVVANGLLLDFEQAASHSIVVRATDQGGKSVSKVIPIHIVNVGPEVVTGNAGANMLVGGTGNDVFNGSGGGDTLRGGGGNDRLNGGLGFDTLVGGLGRDVLTGGANRDVFDFNIASETGKTLFTRDAIRDFSHFQGDDIDLSTIDAKTGVLGNQKFAFIGQGAFTGVKGQLHYKFEVPAKTIVEGDTNGDKKADFQIELTGHKLLVGGDFIL